MRDFLTVVGVVGGGLTLVALVFCLVVALAFGVGAAVGWLVGLVVPPFLGPPWWQVGGLIGVTVQLLSSALSRSKD